METSWVDLLDKNGLKSPQRTRVTVKVSDSTPRGKVGTNWNSPNSYLLHRTTPPTASSKLGTGEKLLMESQRQLRESQLQYKEVYAQLQQQAELIEQLTADNGRLVAQIEGQASSSSSQWDQLQAALKDKNNLTAELEKTKSSLALAQLTATQLEKNLNEKAEETEGILAHMHSLRTEVQHLSARQHGSNHLLTDMERLTRHNAELCERLAATQHSRTVLEREMVAIKRSLLEEKAVNAKLEAVLAKTISERDELGTELDGKLKNVLENLQQERLTQENTLERLHHEKDELLLEVERSQLDLQESRSELALLKDTQLREIEKRCLEVDSMKSQLEQELANLEAERQEFAQQLHRVESERDEFKSRLELSSKQLEQLKAENTSLVTQLEQVRRKFENEHNSLEKANRVLQDQLEKTAADFECVLADTESAKTSNILLQQQVSDLTAQVGGMKEQLSGRCELTNEMKALLDQRAARIRELEKAIAKQKRELSVSMETSSEIFNASRESQDDIISECSSVASLSPGRPRSSRFNSSHAEVIHLKKRLAESRRQTVCLEVQLAQLKTENAKLLGSQQALSSIRDNLCKENDRLLLSIREHQDTQEMTDKESTELKFEISQLQLQVSNNERAMQEERERLRTRIVELEHISTDQQVNQTMIDQLHRQLQAEKHKVTSLQQDLSTLSQLVNKEAAILKDESHQCADTLSALRAEAMQLQETSRITEVVNSTRVQQIEEREASVSSLLGEVEALRAKKTVVEKFLREKSASVEQQITDENKSLSNEVNELREQLKNCTCNHSDEGLSHDTSGHTHQGRLEKLLLRLKSQKRQTNFVRMKLGYALSELRLYKQLKVAMDDQIAKLQESVVTVQERYHHCLERLKQAEELGFGIVDHKTSF